MNIRNMDNNDLEKLSHLDIAYNVIKFEKKTFSTVDLLKELCSILNLSENDYENMIGDFYTSLNLDKRFILIDGKWDISENHSVKMIVDDESDDDLEEYEDMDDEDEVKEIEDEAILEDTEALKDIDDELEDDMEDLSILSDEELEDEEDL